MRSSLVLLCLLVACAPARPSETAAEPATRSTGGRVEDPCITRIETARAQLAINRRASVLGQLDAARCYKRRGRIRHALVPAREALAESLRMQDEQLKVAAQNELQDILPRLSHLKVRTTGEGSLEVVLIDGHDVPLSMLTNMHFSVDPGPHRIQTRGKAESGRTVGYDNWVEIKEGAEETVTIDLR